MMAAVSALPNGRGLRTGGSVPQESTSWDFTQRDNQEVRIPVDAFWCRGSLAVVVAV